MGAVLPCDHPYQLQSGSSMSFIVLNGNVILIFSTGELLRRSIRPHSVGAHCTVRILALYLCLPVHHLLSYRHTHPEKSTTA
jgi:hypothetical protein